MWKYISYSSLDDKNGQYFGGGSFELNHWPLNFDQFQRFLEEMKKSLNAKSIVILCVIDIVDRSNDANGD